MKTVLTALLAICLCWAAGCEKAELEAENKRLEAELKEAKKPSVRDWIKGKRFGKTGDRFYFRNDGVVEFGKSISVVLEGKIQPPTQSQVAEKYTVKENDEIHFTHRDHTYVMRLVWDKTKGKWIGIQTIAQIIRSFGRKEFLEKDFKFFKLNEEANQDPK